MQTGRRAFIFALTVILTVLFSAVASYAAIEYTDDAGITWLYNKSTLYRFKGLAYDGVLTFPESIEGEPVTTIYSTFAINSDATSKAQIRKIIIPDSYTEIMGNAFSGMNNLEEIYLPASITKMGDTVFRNTSLKTIYIPAGLTTLSGPVDYKGVFEGCTTLENINVDPDNPSFASSDGILYSKDMATIVRYPEGRTDNSFDISGGVTSIDDYCFSRTKNLKSISIPSTVSELGKFAFLNSGITDIELPESITQIPKSCFTGTHLTYVIVPDSVTHIADNAFSSCGSLRSAYIPESAELGIDVFVGVPGDFCLYGPGENIVKYASVYGYKYVQTTLDDYLKVRSASVVEDETESVLPSDDDSRTTVKKTQKIKGKSHFRRPAGKTVVLDMSAKTGLRYSSSNKALATVDSKGRVKIKKAGNFTIRVTAVGTGRYKKQVKEVGFESYLAKPEIKAKNQKGRKVRLSWNKVHGADGYNIYIKYPGKKKYVKVLTKPANVKSVTHKGLSKGRKYSYKVQAFQKKGMNINRMTSVKSQAVTVRITK